MFPSLHGETVLDSWKFGNFSKFKNTNKTSLIKTKK